MAEVSIGNGMQTTVMSPVEENYLRISHLLVRVAPSAVRVKFNYEFHPDTLKTVLNNQNKLKTLESLKRKKVINQKQWDLLFPKTGLPSSETFDLTLMICLIKNLADIPIGDIIPFHGDKSESADLTRLKFYRNKIMHSDDGILSDLDFLDWWDEISQAVIRLGGWSFEGRCHRLKEGIISGDDKDILREIKNITEMFDPIPKGLRQLFAETILEWKNEKVAETRAIRRLIEMVNTESIAVAVGASGCGKSTAIHYVAVNLAQEYEIIIVYNPEDMRLLYNPDCKQVFVIDDVLSNATLDEYKAKKWLDMSNDIKKIISNNQAKILASCKTHIFQHRIAKAIDILSDFSCDFLSNDYCLTDDERENIANLYLTKDEISDLKSSDNLSKFYFFPVLCRYYSQMKPVNIVTFFSNPIKAVSNEFELLLTSSDQTTFATLFLFVVYNNCIEESLFTETSKIKPILEDISDNFDLKSKFSIRVIKCEMEKLLSTYLKKQNKTYTVIHDKIFDILVNFCGEHSFDFMLDVAHTDVIRDRFVLTTLFSEKVDHENVVKIPLGKENKYMARLKKDIAHGYIKSVFSNRNLNNSNFRSDFITQIANEIFSLPSKAVFSLIMYIIDRGFCDVLSILLTKDIDLNQLYWDGETPLFKAAHKGSADIVDLLLQQNADPNFPACLKRLDNILELYPGITVNKTCYNSYFTPPFSLLDRSSYKIEGMRKNFSTQTPHFSHQNKEIKAIRFSSNNEVRESRFMSFETYTITPLHTAASHGYIDIVKLLLLYNANPDYVTHHNKISSPLCIAVNLGYTDIVQVLLEDTPYTSSKVPERKNSKQKNIRQSNLQISLHIAVEKGYHDIVRLLLNQKIDFKDYQNYSLPITPHMNFYWKLVDHALDKGHAEIVKMILEHDCNSRFDVEKYILMLFKTICTGKTEIVKLLLEHNFDPKMVYKNNESPLLTATILGHIDIIILLLYHNSDPNVCNLNNKSPLFAACDTRNDRSDIVKLLLKHNSDPNICTKDNASPLHVASRWGHTEIVKLLLEYNCDPTVCDIENESPLYISSFLGYSEIVKLMLDHQRDPNICSKDNGSRCTCCMQLQKGVCYKDIKSPVFAASANGHTEIVKLLLECHCDPNVCHRDNRSLLFAASTNGHIDIVNLLLENNCDSTICDNDNKSPLFAASAMGHTEIVKSLLDHKFDPNVCNIVNESALIVALFNGHSEIVKLLLEHNCDPNICNKNDEDPLFAASSNCQTEVVKLLLDHNSDVNICTKDNKSPLLVASSVGHTEIVKLLLDYDSNVNTCNKDNESPLFAASSNGQTEVVKVLLYHNSDVDICNKDNESPLVVACFRGHTEIVKLLLDHNSNVHICNKDNKSPLLVASSNDRTDIIKLLLDHNSDPNICDKDNKSPLLVSCASDRCNIDTVKLLLDHNSDPNICDKDNKSPLLVSCASDRCNIDTVKLLLDHNSDPNICNEHNESPLCIAASYGRTGIVKLLLDYNSDSNICNKNNESPLFVACYRGHTEIVKLLLDHNSDVNICNKDNESPLLATCASDCCNIEIVKLLLDHNCNPYICNKDNKSPLFVASLEGHTEIVKLLIHYNCDPNICSKDNARQAYAL